MLRRVDPFAPHFARWNLHPDGAPFASLNADLLCLRQGSVPLTLKVPMAI